MLQSAFVAVDVLCEITGFAMDDKRQNREDNPIPRQLFGDVRAKILESLGVLMGLPQWVRAFAVPLLLTVVALLDTVVGTEISFSIFYLVPVVYAGGIVSPRAGRLTALVCAFVWGYLDITNSPPYSAVWIPYWNATVRLGFFLLVNELVLALRHAYIREHRMARTDGLTGVANARVFREHAERTIALSHRNGLPFTIAYIDLDHFKQVNDTFGHSEGDRLLISLANSIAGVLRGTDTLARLGGDEFAILLPDTGDEQALILLKRVMDLLRDTMKAKWQIDITIGAVTFIDTPETVDYAVSLADTLMYNGKKQGRGRILQATWPTLAP